MICSTLMSDRLCKGEIQISIGKADMPVSSNAWVIRAVPAKISRANCTGSSLSFITSIHPRGQHRLHVVLRPLAVCQSSGRQLVQELLQLSCLCIPSHALIGVPPAAALDHRMLSGSSVPQLIRMHAVQAQPMATALELLFELLRCEWKEGIFGMVP